MTTMDTVAVTSHRNRLALMFLRFKVGQPNSDDDSRTHLGTQSSEKLGMNEDTFVPMPV